MYYESYAWIAVCTKIDVFNYIFSWTLVGLFIWKAGEIVSEWEREEEMLSES